MNRFTRSKETPGKGAVSQAGQLKEDKFDALWSNKQIEPSKIAMSVSESLDYGAIKISATVSLACDQNEASINKAGELAFFKALELMRDGFENWDKS